MKIVRFIVKEDKKSCRDAEKINIDTIGEEEKKSLLKEIIDRGLKRAGYKPEVIGTKINSSVHGHAPEES